MWYETENAAAVFSVGLGVGDVLVRRWCGCVYSKIRLEEDGVRQRKRRVKKRGDVPLRMLQDGREQLNGCGCCDGCEAWPGDGTHLVEGLIRQGLEGVLAMKWYR